MLKAGADVNAQTLLGQSALFAAASHDVPHYGLMDALLDAGAEVSQRLKTGQTVVALLQGQLQTTTGAAQVPLERMLSRVMAAGGERTKLDAQAGELI
jgi:hypothetical protein